MYEHDVFICTSIHNTYEPIYIYICEDIYTFALACQCRSSTISVFLCLKTDGFDSELERGTQVNDSFSHQKRDVMELINGLLSGQVHPRDIPLIRVAWHLGFRTKSGHFSFVQFGCMIFLLGWKWGDLILKWRLFFSMDVNILGCFGYNFCFNQKIQGMMGSSGPLTIGACFVTSIAAWNVFWWRWSAGRSCNKNGENRWEGVEVSREYLSILKLRHQFRVVGSIHWGGGCF